MKSTFQTLILFVFSFQIFAQSSLPRSTPEALNISSEGIQQFLDAVESESKHEMHSLMILRNGQVAAEGWWSPYSPESKHTMYSVSKTFTASAIGLAVAEGKLKVTDKVVTFFPESLPATVSPYLAELEIKDLLSMTVGHDKSFNQEVFTQEDWVKAFLSMPIANKPGTKFLYNTSASYMLSAIIQKVTGQNLLEYLKPRLLNPLGIYGLDWETDLDGVAVGGWGIRVKTEDMAKLGQLFLQKGHWNGKQILPESWIDEASTMKIMQEPDASDEKMAANDWIQGYGYQMWRSRYNSYRADGAFGQYILILPELDGLIVITSETRDMQGLLDLAWKYLLPAFDANGTTEKNINKNLKNLSLVSLKSKSNKKLEKEISNNTYHIDKQNNIVSQFNLEFLKDKSRLTLKVGEDSYEFLLSSGEWVLGTTVRKGPNLFHFAQNQLEGLAPFKVAGSYAWKDAETLEIKLKYYESPHTETILITFEGDMAKMVFSNSFENREDWPVFVGKAL
ncbi:serine hydrolase domain-containing protein [Aquiflexum lacus]|uniref:serine hydrolase domain-containing protein n=1 Tax=Aquiflexum lacus TaxID=2483805 RepID=UPI00189372CB|nr:serine hydrolase [Aquiflexum lacus]